MPIETFIAYSDKVVQIKHRVTPDFSTIREFN